MVIGREVFGFSSSYQYFIDALCFFSRAGINWQLTYEISTFSVIILFELTLFLVKFFILNDYFFLRSRESLSSNSKKGILVCLSLNKYIFYDDFPSDFMIFPPQIGFLQDGSIGKRNSIFLSLTLGYLCS